MLAVSALLGGCVTVKEVPGPTGPAYLIKCPGSMDGCLKKAADVCSGEYQIQTSTTAVSGTVSQGTGSVGSSQELLVTCGAADSEPQAGGPPASERRAAKATLSQSDAPDGAAGISFGAAAAEVQGACESAGHKWKQQGDVAVCSGLIKTVGYPGRARVKFCDDGVCEVRLALNISDNDDGEQLIDAYTALHEKLSGLYGTPIEATASVAGRCSHELVECLADDSATLRSLWRWGNGVHLTLEMLEHEGKPRTHVHYVSTSRGDASGF